ncbi:hypothetical protein BH20VER1_BH20VER1_18560 [soil metagenome]
MCQCDPSVCLVPDTAAQTGGGETNLGPPFLNFSNRIILQTNGATGVGLIEIYERPDTDEGAPAHLQPTKRIDYPPCTGGMMAMSSPFWSR